MTGTAHAVSRRRQLSALTPAPVPARVWFVQPINHGDSEAVS